MLINATVYCLITEKYKNNKPNQFRFEGNLNDVERYYKNDDHKIQWFFKIYVSKKLDSSNDNIEGTTLAEREIILTEKGKSEFYLSFENYTYVYFESSKEVMLKTTLINI